jgi:diacylglycerol diphosphate phosphatase/phosphatidate phosphatase
MQNAASRIEIAVQNLLKTLLFCAVSAAGLGYLSFYLAGKLHLGDLRGHVSKLVLAFVPSILAVFVGYTRVCDYKHHPTDVLTGLLVGE